MENLPFCYQLTSDIYPLSIVYYAYQYYYRFWNMRQSVEISEVNTTCILNFEINYLLRATK